MFIIICLNLIEHFNYDVWIAVDSRVGHSITRRLSSQMVVIVVISALVTVVVEIVVDD